MSVENCKIIDLQVLHDHRGKIAIAESGTQVPFDIKRVYYLFDVPSFAERGGHAHKELQQIIIAVSGSFNVHIDDGVNKKTIILNNPSKGLYLCPMIWRELDCFSGGAVCLSLVSDHYKEDDYYRNYKEFKKEI
jgi:hypothetical protein